MNFQLTSAWHEFFDTPNVMKRVASLGGKEPPYLCVGIHEMNHMDVFCELTTLGPLHQWLVPLHREVLLQIAIKASGVPAWWNFVHPQKIHPKSPTNHQAFMENNQNIFKYPFKIIKHHQKLSKVHPKHHKTNAQLIKIHPKSCPPLRSCWIKSWNSDRRREAFYLAKIAKKNPGFSKNIPRCCKHLCQELLRWAPYQLQLGLDTTPINGLINR